jgi:hypothetical protein
MHCLLKQYHPYIVERHGKTLLPQYLAMYRYVTSYRYPPNLVTGGFFYEYFSDPPDLRALSVLAHVQKEFNFLISFLLEANVRILHRTGSVPYRTETALVVIRYHNIGTECSKVLRYRYGTLLKNNFILCSVSATMLPMYLCRYQFL